MESKVIENIDGGLWSRIKSWPAWFKILFAAAIFGGALLSIWLVWAVGILGTSLVANNFVDELSIYIPANKFLLKVVFYLFMLILIWFSFNIFSFSAKKTKYRFNKCFNIAYLLQFDNWCYCN